MTLAKMAQKNITYCIVLYYCQARAPFIFKVCILIYNAIFIIKVPENWMFH